MSKQVTLMNARKVRAIDSSTQTSPIVVTDAGHGLSTGDQVTIISHATNTAANGTWKVTYVSATEFSLDGSVGNGIGAGTGSWAEVDTAAVSIEDAETVSITVDTDGGGDAAMTVKFWCSDQENAPDAAKAQSVTNQYDFVDVIDKQNGTSIDGDTGFVVAGADDHRQFETNIDHAKWFGLISTAGTEGEVTIKVRIWDKTI